jgi:hypothetical protein
MTAARWSPRRKGVLMLALTAMAAAGVVVAIAVRAQVSAPDPRSAGRIDAMKGGSATGSAPPHRGRGHEPQPAPTDPAPLGPSRPVTIAIPAIGVHAPVNPIGLAADGTLAVPQPGPHLDQAAWFENSPTPGQPGPAIIEGHVDSVEGPSVFFELGGIHPGDRVVVRRADDRVLTFKVDAVRDFPKTRFPTRLVYGGHALSRPTLRLITCSDYDSAIHHHLGNEVVFAHLVHARKQR